MVQHIVMLRFTDKNNTAVARNLLEGMRGKIPSLLRIQTGVNFNGSDAAYDLVLITEHADRAALDIYQDDPLHMEVKAGLARLDGERVVVDFDTGD